MAERRMFSKSVTGSDAFQEMPLSSQALYFHIGMQADDDGFCAGSRSIMRLIGANQNDLDLLLVKGFLIQFDDGVVVVKHWRINNFVRKDTYHETEYLEDKQRLFVKNNNVYTLDSAKGKPLIGRPSTERQRAVNEPSTQDRLGKDSLDKSSVGKDSLEEISEGGMGETFEERREHWKKKLMDEGDMPF